MNNKIIRTLILPIIFIILWFIATQFKIISPIFLPKINILFFDFINILKTKELCVDIFTTLYRLSLAYIIAVFLGTIIGILMGYSKKIYESLDFSIDFARSIPVTALFPLFILFFGIGDMSKIAVAVWGAGLIIIINTMHGVHVVKKSYLQIAQINKMKTMNIFRKIIIPSALPNIFTGYRLAISFCLVVIIVTEMFIGTNHGLGQRIINDQLIYNISDMYLIIFITGFIGFLLNKIILKVENKLIHWKGR